MGKWTPEQRANYAATVAKRGKIKRTKKPKVEGGVNVKDAIYFLRRARKIIDADGVGGEVDLMVLNALSALGQL